MQIFAGQDTLYAAEAVKSRVWPSARAHVVAAAVIAAFVFAPQQSYADVAPTVWRSAFAGHTPRAAATISVAQQAYADSQPVISQSARGPLTAASPVAAVSVQQQRYADVGPVIFASAAAPAAQVSSILGARLSASQQPYADPQPVSMPSAQAGPTGAIMAWAGGLPQGYLDLEPYLSRPPSQVVLATGVLGARVTAAEQAYTNASPLVLRAVIAGHVPTASPFFIAAPQPIDLTQQAIFARPAVATIGRLSYTIVVGEQSYTNVQPAVSRASVSGHTPRAAPFFIGGPQPRDLTPAPIFSRSAVGRTGRLSYTIAVAEQAYINIAPLFMETSPTPPVPPTVEAGPTQLAITECITRLVITQRVTRIAIRESSTTGLAIT